MSHLLLGPCGPRQEVAQWAGSYEPAGRRRRCSSRSSRVSSFAGPALADQAATIAAKFNGNKIKTRSISGSKLKNNTITGKQVNEGKLGKVPSAAKADSATSATNATTATNATNSSQLLGKPGSEYLLKTDTAANSSKLGGKDPNQYVSLGGQVSGGTGTPSQGSGFTSSRTGTGAYSVSFPAGTFSPEGGSCHFPIPSVVAFSSAARIVTVPGRNCGGDGSGGFSVRITDDAATVQDTTFMFLAL